MEVLITVYTKKGSEDRGKMRLRNNHLPPKTIVEHTSNVKCPFTTV